MNPQTKYCIGIVAFLALSGCNKEVKTVPYTNCLTEIPAVVSIEAASTTIGSDKEYPEERPVRAVEIAAFNIDATEVTNAQFAAFVDATGYVTSAEKPQPGFGKPGAGVFKKPSLTSPGWWEFSEGADWRHPEGPDSNIDGRDNDPVVQVSNMDAKAYADWKGRRLPTEAEWEYASKAGSTTRFVWGEERAPDGVEQANTWQGAFPIKNTLDDGYGFRAPVGCYKPNKFGLYDMIGNVWEWTSSRQGTSGTEAIYTIKGGSFLCADNYCARYRPSARQFQEEGLPTNHIGFRTVGDVE